MSVGVGIGCHSLVLAMSDERVGNLVGLTPMGNEGMQWVGMSPYVELPHIVQNLGDGTFCHSGRLAIGAAVASGVNMTYKLLYNDAIGMTGGQRPTGRAEVTSIVRQLLEVGVVRLLITTDDVTKCDDVSLPTGVQVWSRQRLDEAHRVLAQEQGVTALIHDQTCTAEARRLRKRGLLATPSKRIVINHRICEGCGHCGEISNCLSVQPFETDFGRKTRIDQTTCNFDYSCVEGDCPSFVEIDVEARRLRPRRARGAAGQPNDALNRALDTHLPAPVVRVRDDYFNVRLTGVGGTGVVTVAQVLGTAAMLDGLDVRGLDQTGLSQKAGPVVSDLRFARNREDSASRIGSFEADVLIALDQLVAASPAGLDALSSMTIVVGSSSTSPTGAMIAHPELQAPSPVRLADRIARVSDASLQKWVDASATTTKLLGNAVTANVFVMGMAVQFGALPLSINSVEEALRLNGAAVDTNLRAFQLGRLAIARPDVLKGTLAAVQGASIAVPLWVSQAVAPLQLSVENSIRVERYANDLIGHSNIAYAKRYLALVERAAHADSELEAQSEFVGQVIEQGYRLMAYKDEYEVARLLVLDDQQLAVRSIAGERRRISFLLHPPLLRALGMQRKIRLGEWTLPVFRCLAMLKVLRGTAFDIFGPTKLRRKERQLRDQYEQLINSICSNPSLRTLVDAVRLAALPNLIRGYEDIKMARIEQYERELANR